MSPTIRDYTQSLMNPPKRVYTDERGNLAIDPVVDQDPTEAGIQEKPYEYRPPSNEPGIFMTNIPKGGIGPSLDYPQGVPGTEKDYEETRQAAKKEGGKFVDLSPKKKEKKGGEVPSWVGSGIDLNAPGARENFRLQFNMDTYGYDLPRINPAETAKAKWDPVEYPKEYEALKKQLDDRVGAARLLEDRMLSQYDKEATVQKSMQEHKLAQAEKTKTENINAKQRFIELGQQRVTLGDQISKLQVEYDKANSNNSIEPVSKEYIGILKKRIDGVNNQIKDIDYQRDQLRKKYNVEPMSTEMAAAHQQNKPTAETIANVSKRPVGTVKTDMTEAQRLAAQGKARGIPDNQLEAYIVSELKKSRQGGSPGKASMGAGAAGPAETPKSKVVPTGQSQKTESKNTAGMGSKPPSTKNAQIFDEYQKKSLGNAANVEIQGTTRNGFTYGYAPGFGTVIYKGLKWTIPSEVDFELIKSMGK